MKKFLTICFVGFLVVGCPTQNQRETAQPVQPPDTDKCEAGCKRLTELGCEEAKGSDSNDPNSCKNECEYVQREGLVFLNPGCWVTMTKCSEIDTVCSDR